MLMPASWEHVTCIDGLEAPVTNYRLSICTVNSIDYTYKMKIQLNAGGDPRGLHFLKTILNQYSPRVSKLK